MERDTYTPIKIRRAGEFLIFVLRIFTILVFHFIFSVRIAYAKLRIKQVHLSTNNISTDYSEFDSGTWTKPRLLIAHKHVFLRWRISKWDAVHENSIIIYKRRITETMPHAYTHNQIETIQASILLIVVAIMLSIFFINAFVVVVVVGGGGGGGKSVDFISFYIDVQ